jgi:hypothetical protein
MKVRIVSGSQAGAVVDMPQVEAEINISSGFAELYDPEKDVAANASEKPAADKPKSATKSATKATRKK